VASNAVGGGAVDAEGFLKYLLHFHKLGYTRALNVTQRGAGANMSVDVNIDSDGYGGALFATASAVPYFGYTNAAINSTVTTADPTNPRKDIVVAYIDLSLITTGTTNNLGAFKIKVVPGTAAASPADPSGATIQASVGAGNPYIQLARVSLTAALASITNAVITDLRTPAANAMPYLWGGALNTKGHLVPNQADGTVVTTTDTGSVSATMLAATSVTPSKLGTGAAAASVATSESTTSSSYVDLTTTTDTVTVTIGANGLALVSIYALSSNAASGGNWLVGFAISGATTQAAADNFALKGFSAVGTQSYSPSAVFLLTGLGAGSTTFKMKYKSDGTNASSFANRRIAVVPL
jgi:hypothetical protein